MELFNSVVLSMSNFTEVGVYLLYLSDPLEMICPYP